MSETEQSKDNTNWGRIYAGVIAFLLLEITLFLYISSLF